MRAGNLRDRVTLQVSVSVRNDYGEQVESWQDVSSFSAHVLPLSGSESDENHGKVNEQRYKVRFRPRKDVDVSKRFVWQGRVLEILTPPIDPYGRRDELNVTCKEVVNA